MSDENIKKNIEENRRATQSSRYKKSGLTTRKTELSSKNFDKLMKQRGLSKKDTAALKASSDRRAKMQVRHAKKGESCDTYNIYNIYEGGKSYEKEMFSCIIV